MQDRLLFIRTPFVLTNLETWESLLIRSVAGYYNHCARLCYIDNVAVVLESVGPQGVVNPIPLNDWLRLRKGQIIHEIPATRSLTKEEILSYIGKRYDYASALWALPIYRLTGKWFGRKHTAADKVYCFELVALTEGYSDWYRYLFNITKQQFKEAVEYVN